MGRKYSHCLAKATLLGDAPEELLGSDQVNVLIPKDVPWVGGATLADQSCFAGPETR